jgi:hypothetical protein
MGWQAFSAKKVPRSVSHCRKWECRRPSTAAHYLGDHALQYEGTQLRSIISGAMVL